MIAVALAAGDPAVPPPPHLAPCCRAAYRLAFYFDAIEPAWAEWPTGHLGAYTPGRWESDICWLRQEWWKHAACPDADDLGRFVDAEYTDRAVDLNRLTRNLAEYHAASGVVGWQAHRRACEACDELMEAWGWLKCAHKAQCRADLRRHLARLRAQIGAANFYRGQMPPPVPLWWNPPR